MLSLLQSLRSRLSQWDPQLYQTCPCPWGSSSPPLVNPTPYPNPNPNACMSRTPSCEPSTSSTRPTARTRACSGGEPLRNCTAALVDACTYMAGGLRAVSTCVGPCMPSPPPCSSCTQDQAQRDHFAPLLQHLRPQWQPGPGAHRILQEVGPGPATRLRACVSKDWPHSLIGRGRARCLGGHSLLLLPGLHDQGGCAGWWLRWGAAAQASGHIVLIPGIVCPECRQARWAASPAPVGLRGTSPPVLLLIHLPWGWQLPTNQASSWRCGRGGEQGCRVCATAAEFNGRLVQ